MKNVLVYGAGVSAQGAMKLLEKKRVSYTLFCDDMGEIPNVEAFDVVLKSPGIPNNKLLLKMALLKGIEIIDEIELAYRFMPKNVKVVAITGTNGKTTTTLNMYNAFRALGYKTAYAGNIGISYAEIVASEVHLDVIILELSSFQLEHLDTFKADAAILINLTPDHLDRYETVEEYYAVKWNVFKNQTESDIAVLNQEDKNITNSEKIKSLNTLMFSILNKSGSDFGYVNHQIRLYTDMCDAKFIEQFGTHNIENFLAICGVLYHFGHRAKDIIVAQEAFKCAEHRLEKFHTYHCVDFYNDSKATNSDSTKQAINSLYKRQDIHLICGGKEKNLDFTDLVEMIIEKDVKSVSLIGQTADRLEIQLREAGYLKEKIYNLSTLTCALDFLKKHLNFNHPSSVLLSPATSSYDQFKNFEDRGWIFKELVKEKF